jgi:bifunctional non-homologous end joining protein LigD
VTWEEVKKKKIQIEDFTIENMLERIKKKGDLFEPVLKKKQSLEDAFEKAKKRK